MGTNELVAKDTTNDSQVTATSVGTKRVLDAASVPVTYRENSNAGYTYYGVAAVGSSESAAVWRIFREEASTGTIIYADGNANFDNIWDNRTGLTYS